jgi:acyl-CoA dehydrogenase
MASGSDHIVAETAARICADLADPQTINSARDRRWMEPLWRALVDAGLPHAWAAEDLGGAGASLADGFTIVGVAGRYALPVPLAETLLASWLLSRAGIPVSPGALTVAPVRPRDRIVLGGDGRLSGRAGNIPFASNADWIAVLAESDAGHVVALVTARDHLAADGANLAGDPANVVVLDGVKPHIDAPAPETIDKTALMLMGATIRAVQIAGALEAILAMSVRYANERVAFERPIGKFQAVQQNLARLAGETAAALAAAGSAADAIAQTGIDSDALLLEAASAKIRCGESAAEGASIAHQVHGAIGFTKEHVLHRFTLRMLAWRDDFGSESYWANRLGTLVAARGSDQFWHMLAAR